MDAINVNFNVEYFNDRRKGANKESTAESGLFRVESLLQRGGGGVEAR